MSPTVVASFNVILSLSKDGRAITLSGGSILRQAQDDTVAGQDDTVAGHDDTVAGHDDTVAA